MVAFTNLKFASLQMEDVFLLGLTTWCFASFAANGSSLRISNTLRPLLKDYALLLVLLFTTSVFALRLQFFPLVGVSILKEPVFLSLSRFIQLTAVIVGFIWLANLLQNNREALRKALQTYWFTGLFVCSYAIVSYLLLHFAHINIGGASPGGGGRARGTFNEGGPFGLYVVSLFVVAVLRRLVFGCRIGTVAAATVLIAFALAFSKAGFVALGVMGIAWVASHRISVRTVVLGSLIVSILAAVGVALHPERQIRDYTISYENIHAKIEHGHRADYNLVLGRVAAGYIVPRMVEAHPLLGIGIGNYPLMRNNPKYLGPLPPVYRHEDLPGLGLIGYAPDFGIPGLLAMSWLLTAPFRICRRTSLKLSVLGLFQIICHLFGAQLTFFYPWFVSACILGSYSVLRSRSEYGMKGVLNVSRQAPPVAKAAI